MNDFSDTNKQQMPLRNKTGKTLLPEAAVIEFSEDGGDMNATGKFQLNVITGIFFNGLLYQHYINTDIIRSLVGIHRALNKPRGMVY
jgi:hypothetical protein